MRSVLALVLAATAVAIAAGLALPADAVKVGTTSLSSSGLADEMAAISNSPSWQCYVQATYFVDSKGGTAPAVPGATAQTWSNAASRLWSSIRTPQLSQVQFVQAHDPAAFSQASLAQAKLSLEERIYATIAQAFQASTQSASYTCPAAAGGAKTLESMPPWFVDAQVRAEAARIGMLALLPNPVPEGGPALAAWYRTHAGEFDTTCVADIIVGSLPLAEYIQAQLHAGHPARTARPAVLGGRDDQAARWPDRLLRPDIAVVVQRAHLRGLHTARPGGHLPKRPGPVLPVHPDEAHPQRVRNDRLGCGEPGRYHQRTRGATPDRCAPTARRRDGRTVTGLGVGVDDSGWRGGPAARTAASVADEPLGERPALCFAAHSVGVDSVACRLSSSSGWDLPARRTSRQQPAS